MLERFELRLELGLLAEIASQVGEETTDGLPERVLAVVANRLGEAHRLGVHTVIDKALRNARQPRWQARREHPVERLGVLHEPLLQAIGADLE